MARPNLNIAAEEAFFSPASSPSLLHIAESHQVQPNESPIEVAVDTRRWELAHSIARAAGSVSMRELVDIVGMTTPQAAATLERMKMEGDLLRQSTLPNTAAGNSSNPNRLPGPVVGRHSVFVPEYNGKEESDFKPDLEWVKTYRPTWRLTVTDEYLAQQESRSPTPKDPPKKQPDGPLSSEELRQLADLQDRAARHAARQAAEAKAASEEDEDDD
jgi:hypothetical protein